MEKRAENKHGSLIPKYLQRTKVIGAKQAVTCLSFSPDGQLLLSGDTIVRLRDVPSLDLLHCVSGSTEQTYSSASQHGKPVEFSPDCSSVLFANGRMWDIRNNCELYQYNFSGQVATFSSDGKRIATGETIWDVDSGEKVTVLTENGRRILEMNVQAFSQDDTKILVSNNKVTALFDVIDGTLLDRKMFRSNCMAFSPNGKIFVTNGTGNVRVWSAIGRYMDEIRTLDIPGNISVLAFSPCSKLLCCGLYGKSSTEGDIGKSISNLSLWDVLSGKKICDLNGHFPISTITAVAFSSDGRWLASASSNNDHSIRLWDLTDIHRP